MPWRRSEPHEVITVPGALEIPAAIAIAEEGGRYDGYVALGTVIRGETYHFEIVSNESARGLMDLSVSKQLCLGNGVLTVEDEAQAQDRAGAAQRVATRAKRRRARPDHGLAEPAAADRPVR